LKGVNMYLLKKDMHHSRPLQRSLHKLHSALQSFWANQFKNLGRRWKISTKGDRMMYPTVLMRNQSGFW